MKGRLKMLLLTVSLPALLFGQQIDQIDKPVADDLADQRNAAQSAYKHKAEKIAATERALHSRVAADPESLKSRGALAQIQIERCLASGDYQRSIAKIYSDAAVAADRLAADFDSQTNADSSAPALAELQKQIDDLERRKSELEANSTQESESELASLKALEKRLQEAKDVYQRMPVNDGGAEQARRMRAMRDRLADMAKEAEAYVAVFNTVCQSERQILVELAKEERNEKDVDAWTRFMNGGAPAPRVGEGLSSQTNQVYELEEKVKDYERVLDDPAALQQRIEYLNQIISGATSQQRANHGPNNQ